MRVIQQNKDHPTVLEIAWMWLPTFIGQNSSVLSELDHVLAAKFPPPVEATEEKLDEMNEFVIDWIDTRFNIPGLGEYVRGIKHVGE